MMNNGSMFFHIVIADFLERTRTYAYFITIIVSLIVSFLFIPSSEAGYGTIVVSGYRGIYNSAWIGVSMALSVSSFLSLVGFYLVKNTIDRDIQSGVGQIIASTPLKKSVYMFGKFISNFLVLLSIVFISFCMSIFMQWIRREDNKIIIEDLFLPYLFVVIPVISVVASFALLFESSSILRGKVGNVIYFFLWSLFLQVEFTLELGSVSISSLLSNEIIYNAIKTQYQQLFPASMAKVEDGIVALNEPLNTFKWHGINWAIEIFTSRILWILLSLFLIIIASWVFKGFDDFKVKRKDWWERRRKKLEPINNWNHLTKMMLLSPIQIKYSFLYHIKSELTLLLNRQPIWWYIIASVFIVASLLAPMPITREYLSVMSWLWPLFIWSSMGIRETRFHTSEIIFSSPSPVVRQITAIWLAGVLIAMGTGIGYAGKLVIVGDMPGLAAWFIGSLYVPALALSLGIWTKTNKSFELIYLSIIFIGLFNNIRLFDFLGIMDGSVESGIPIAYLLFTIVLLAGAYYGRYRHTQL
ncbi:ABC transporter permease [Metabacillus fastidiosus]|uniref:ABC transporter permease n=1 Tax=Metabacillus fastidiosus TaxID=1458 RepID=UPI003D2CCE72